MHVRCTHLAFLPCWIPAHPVLLDRYPKLSRQGAHGGRCAPGAHTIFSQPRATRDRNFGLDRICFGFKRAWARDWLHACFGLNHLNNTLRIFYPSFDRFELLHVSMFEIRAINHSCWIFHPNPKLNSLTSSARTTTVVVSC